MASEDVVHGLSVDLEDWFSLTARMMRGENIPVSRRVIDATHVVLDLFEESGVRATFFVLGSVAEAFPHLIREVADRGHEIGTHGYAHRRVYDMGAKAFREDLLASIQAIEAACGARPRGHRAAEFSITRRSEWAFEILADAGMRFDSSVFPIVHNRYGIPGAPRDPYTVSTAAGPIAELPLATLEVRGRRIPAAGGGYLRLFPYAVIDGAVRQAAARGRPAVIYVHPYELDPLPLSIELPLLAVKRRVRLALATAFRRRSGVNLRRLLRSHRFGPLGAIALPADAP